MRLYVCDMNNLPSVPRAIGMRQTTPWLSTLGSFIFYSSPRLTERFLSCGRFSIRQCVPIRSALLHSHPQYLYPKQRVQRNRGNVSLKSWTIQEQIVLYLFFTSLSPELLLSSTDGILLKHSTTISWCTFTRMMLFILFR